MTFDERVQAAAREMIRARAYTNPVITSWDALLDYCHMLVARSPIERFHILYLDRKNRLIHDEELQHGTVDHVPVYPREVVKAALLHDASAIIMIHNHPAGDPTPSDADIKVLNLLGITLHDHVIIGRPAEYSFRAHGNL